MKLFSSIRDRHSADKTYHKGTQVEVFHRDIATLLKCVDLLQECMQGFGGRDGYDKVNEALAAVRALSEQGENNGTK